jgi:hypothetical protein
MTKQCEGYIRRGGAFTFGRPEWFQCKNDATMKLMVTQNEKKESFACCDECLTRVIDKKIHIESMERF